MYFRKLILSLFISIPCLVGIVSVAPALGAEHNYKSEVTEYGYYRQITELARERNIASTSGYVRTGGEVQLESQTNEIPLKLHQLFGFKFRIEGFEGKDAVQLKLVVKHPVITRPNGSTSKGYSYSVLLDVKNGVINNQSGYSIDHDYEMVEGDWTFEYWYQDQKLLSHSFKTVKDSGMQQGTEGTKEEVSPEQSPSQETVQEDSPAS